MSTLAPTVRANGRWRALRVQTYFLLVCTAQICGCSIVNDDCAAQPDESSRASGHGSCAAQPDDSSRANASARLDDASRESLATAAQPLLQAAPSNRGDVVAILTSHGVKEQLCTGTVLLPNLVLTARHCITTERSAMGGVDCSTARVADPDPLTRVVVIAGRDVDLVPEDAEHSVREFLLPEDEGKLCGQDIALLRLETPLTNAPVVVPGAAQANATFNAAGYGIFDGDWGQQRETPNAQFVCDGLACSDARVATNEFLARSGACEGDSGGPAFDARGVQFGIASRSTADCSETTYLSLAGYLPWLAVTASYAAQAGGYELPAWVKVTDGSEIPVPLPGAKEPVPRLSARGGCGLMQGSLHSRRDGSFGLAMLALWAVLIRRSRQSSFRQSLTWLRACARALNVEVPYR